MPWRRRGGYGGRFFLDRALGNRRHMTVAAGESSMFGELEGLEPHVPDRE
jgi:hypothetical protein